MKVDTIIAAKSGKVNSFWFDGQVAIVSDGSKSISIEAVGAKRVTFNDGEDQFEGQEAVNEAIDRNYSDKKISNVTGEDGFSESNWFQFYDMDKDEVIEDITSIHYNEAVKIAKGILSLVNA